MTSSSEVTAGEHPRSNETPPATKGIAAAAESEVSNEAVEKEPVDRSDGGAKPAHSADTPAAFKGNAAATVTPPVPKQDGEEGTEGDEKDENETSPSATEGRVALASKSEVPKEVAEEEPVDRSEMDDGKPAHAADTQAASKVNTAAAVAPPVTKEDGEEGTKGDGFKHNSNPQAASPTSPDRNDSIVSKKQALLNRRKGLVELLRQRQVDCNKEEDFLCQKMQKHIDAQDEKLLELLLM
eukprot:CAMPEP_0194063906 /NCGR_PEP_ID=MMETSP0009_2-20130614/81557_1 /TAXON_ID=210454 /ORGANISM="Grammatophora oceanica, Strain CCMP 410" /LENGTH=239 /DNA_ID=CAMNT_0038716197 /DNA_START=1210 /DNA_END=1930 /DNA_ORIENTATION=-